MIYQVTAPAEGTLSLQLTSFGAGDLTLSVRTACGDDASEIACANMVGPDEFSPETLAVDVTADQQARIQAIGTHVALTCAGLLDFYNRYDKDRYHIPGAPLHDPCVIAYLLQPGLFSGQRRRVEIETEGTHTTGRTVVDWWQRSPRAPNALVINDVAADGFFDLLCERLARL